MLFSPTAISEALTLIVTVPFTKTTSKYSLLFTFTVTLPVAFTTEIAIVLLLPTNTVLASIVIIALILPAVQARDGAQHFLAFRVVATG